MTTLAPLATFPGLLAAILGLTSAGPQGGSHELVVIEPVGTSSLATSGVSDVSDLGLVVGQREVNGSQVSFEWTLAGGFRTPTHLPANTTQRRVNNAGDSVAPGIPFLVRMDGTLVPIPDPLGGVSTGGSDVNDALTVIGHGVPTGTSSGLFAWSPQGGAVTVGIPNGSELRRLNAHGRAVGNRLINGTGKRAFVVDLATQAWVDLHLLLGNTGASEAFDVNDHGAVVGFGPNGVSLAAFVWTPAAGFVFLPGLAGGETMRVHPRAIDDRGRVVGMAMTGAGDFHAFLWDPVTGMVDLNTLVTGGTFQLVEGLDISETGVIVGRGFHGAAWGPERGFILHEIESGTTHCASAPNSTGATATLAAHHLDLNARTMELFAARLPSNANAYSLASRHAGFVANPGNSSGHLCLASPIGRVVGGSVLTTGPGGTLREIVDLDAIPQPTGAVAAQPGETWHFQFWFRDSIGGLPTSNFTDGLRVVFP